MNVKEIRRKNLRALARAVNGVTQLAERLGKSQSQISHLIGTNPIKNIGDKFAAQVEKTFNKPNGWLDQLHASIEEEGGIYEIDSVRLASHYVPYLNWQEVNNWLDTGQLPSNKTRINYLITHIKVSSLAFALLVEGDSMEASNGVSFPHGSTIVIDPEYHASSGSFVVAKPSGSNQIIFKQFIVDGSHRFLKPLNPRYPLIEINPQARICGVVRLLLMEFK